MIESEKNNLIENALKIEELYMKNLELIKKIFENCSISNVNTNFDNESELIEKLINNLANIGNLTFLLKERLEKIVIGDSIMSKPRDYGGPT